jgi:hypothetical protein
MQVPCRTVTAGPFLQLAVVFVLPRLWVSKISFA